LFLLNLTPWNMSALHEARRKKDSAVISPRRIWRISIWRASGSKPPLFSIPAHAFLFNAGNIDKHFYMDSLQLEESEYNLIRYPQRGVCLYKCGTERYNLVVQAPEHKVSLFGKAGGR
jgi:hypothetical protein